MTGEEAVGRVADALQAHNAPFMLVGSFTTNFYGLPRLTHDADLVVAVGPDAVAGLADQLLPDIRLNPQLMFETVTMSRYQLLEVVGTQFTIELFQLSDDPHDQERFRRRVSVAYLGRAMPFPTAEDVVVTKVRWAHLSKRTKDRDDVRNVITVMGNSLDWPYIHHWCDRHGTRALLDEIRTSVPPE